VRFCDKPGVGAGVGVGAGGTEECGKQDYKCARGCGSGEVAEQPVKNIGLEDSNSSAVLGNNKVSGQK
jgi:hypothetical protein